MAIIQWQQNYVTSAMVKVDELNPKAFKDVIFGLHVDCVEEMEGKAEKHDDYYEVISMTVTPHITIANNQMFIVMTGVLIYRYDEKGG